MKLTSIAILIAAFSLTGCTLPSISPSTLNPETPGITGNWQLTLTSNQTPYVGATLPVGIYLIASGNTVTGTAAISVACPAFGCAWPTITINPQLSGTIDTSGKIALTSTSLANMVFTLTAIKNGPSLQAGTYTLSNGGMIDQGTVTGVWYPPLNGTYSGTVISSNSGQSLQVTTTLNQTTTPDARGYMHVSASAAITGESCFTAATMAGPVETYSGLAGNSYSVTLVTTNNPSIFINEFGTLSQDGKTIQFIYNVIDINGGRVCDNNAWSNATLTLQ